MPDSHADLPGTAVVPRRLSRRDKGHVALLCASALSLAAVIVVEARAPHA